MRTYNLKTLEQSNGGYNTLQVVTASDLTAAVIAAGSLALTAMAAGDAVTKSLIHVKTAVAGPSGAITGQVKTGTGAVAITPTVALKTGTGAVTDNTVVGATVSTAAENLVLALATGGDNAAATAGEIWVWSQISRAADRNVQA